MQSASPYFSRSYALARERFTAAARPLATRFASYPIAPKGREGEDLATDVAPVSYTHLDVYKRQVAASSRAAQARDRKARMGTPGNGRIDAGILARSEIGRAHV